MNDVRRTTQNLKKFKAQLYCYAIINTKIHISVDFYAELYRHRQEAVDAHASALLDHIWSGYDLDL